MVCLPQSEASKKHKVLVPASLKVSLDCTVSGLSMEVQYKVEALLAGQSINLGLGVQMTLDGAAHPSKDQVCTLIVLLNLALLLGVQGVAVARSAFGSLASVSLRSLLLY